MMSTLPVRGVALALALLALPGVRVALAQQSAGPEVTLPRPADIEPGVDTSAAVASPTTAVPPAPVKPAAAPRTAKAVTGKDASKDASKDAPQGGKALDRLELDSTQITGNRELPKVLYIVPWKRPDLGDLSGRPPNTLVDEILAPIDRDVFQRENRYYDALKPDSPHSAASGGRETPTSPPAASQPRDAP
jgi:hypothetical protein